MLRRFLTFIKKQLQLSEDTHILLAVSGGVDSMTMAHLFMQAGYRVAVAHVNYHLRGAESDLDQELVATWCMKHDVPFYLKSVDSEEYQTQESIQMAARRIRYTFFQELVSGFDVVATAHNANDNVETVLLNLTKGTGIHGLMGIAPQRDYLIRPLLFATREEIEAFAKSEHVIWREDKSNQKSDYQRNWLRNKVVPLLREINPGLEHTFESTILRMKGVAQIVDEEIDELKSRIEQQDGRQILDLEWFTEDLKSEVLLSELIKSYGFTFASSRDLSRAIAQKESGKIFKSATYEINLDRHSLLISKNEDGYSVNAQIPEQMGRHVIGQKNIELSRIKGNNFPVNCPRNVAYFDVDQLDFPLIIQNWEQGDHFRPLGMKGKKKVSDYMIDNKIPLTLKKDLLVVKSAGEIIWLVGHRIDERFKITPETTQMLKIEVID